MTDATTPIDVIANVSRIVTAAVDRITGDRVEYPLLVAAACVEALKKFAIESRVMYGEAAWVEVMEDHSVLWAGCWGQNIHFWVATQFGEVVDLNLSVACRKRAHDRRDARPMYSPPILWSTDLPAFCRYRPEGVAEVELTEPADQRRMEAVLKEIEEKCGPGRLTAGGEEQFPNEPVLCPGRRILDDSHGTFKHFDRALSVKGVPKGPL